MTSYYEQINPRYNKILKFWFGDPNNPEETKFGKEQSHWWNSDTTIDNQIRHKFIGDYERACGGEYDSWKEDAYGTLSLIILFDQISRNIFRGKPQAYATDHLALELAKMALERGYAAQLNPEMIHERKFMITPFAHSENLEDQIQNVALTQELKSHAWNSIAEKYHYIILRFGRFPHRNKILGRVSTPKEIQMLKTECQSWLR